MMAPQKLCLCLALALAAATPTSVGAKMITSVDHAVTGNLPQAALSWAMSNATRFGSDGKPDLRVSTTTMLRNGMVVRLQQRFKGLPLLDAHLSVLIKGQRIIAASGVLQSVRVMRSGVRLSRQRIVRLLPSKMPTATVRRATLALSLGDGIAVPVWLVDLATSRPFGLWRARLDAQTGKLLSAVSTLRRAKGNAYSLNPTVGKLQEFELPGLKADLKPEDGLVGEFADVSSCGRVAGDLVCERQATADAEGNYLYQPKEPSAQDPFAEVHAYYHVDAFHRWLTDEFAFSRTGATQKVDVIVNLYRENSSGEERGIYNAFFGDFNGDNKGDLVFGQGQRDYAYDADVIYHEFVHSVVDQSSNLSATIDKLGFNEMPLALNEAFADLLSSAFTGDPTVGEYAGEGAIRVLTGAASCPNDLRGESHLDGLIWSRGVWKVRQQVTDTKAFDLLIYETMVALSKNATFEEAATLFYKLAQEADPAVAALVQKEFTSRGLFDCSRIVSLDQPRRGYIRGTRDLPGSTLIPTSVQYKITVPENGIQMLLEVKPPASIANTHWGQRMSDSLGAYVRKGQPVEFNGLGGAAKTVHDHLMINTDDQLTFSTENSGSDLTLEPGATYYISPVNVGSWGASFQISAAIIQSDPPEPDAAPAEPDAGPATPGPSTEPAIETPEIPSSGCAVSSGNNGAPRGALPLLLLAVAIRRRRRFDNS